MTLPRPVNQLTGENPAFPNFQITGRDVERDNEPFERLSRLC